jgi:hypothetical protein
MIENEIECPNFCQVCGTQWKGSWTGCKCNPLSSSDKANRLRDRAARLDEMTNNKPADIEWNCEPIGSYFDESKTEKSPVKYRNNNT